MKTLLLIIFWDPAAGLKVGRVLPVLNIILKSIIFRQEMSGGQPLDRPLVQVCRKPSFGILFLRGDLNNENYWLYGYRHGYISTIKYELKDLTFLKIFNL